MKNSAWYNKLWQNKMQELPLQEDANSAWQKMQGLLDDNMPVTHTTGNVKPNLWGSKLITVLGVITTAALLYFAGAYLLKHHHAKKPNSKHTKMAIDSAMYKNNYKNDSSTSKDNLRYTKQDSVATAKDSASTQNEYNDDSKHLTTKTKDNSVSNHTTPTKPITTNSKNYGKYNAGKNNIQKNQPVRINNTQANRHLSLSSNSATTTHHRRYVDATALRRSNYLNQFNKDQQALKNGNNNGVHPDSSVLNKQDTLPGVAQKSNAPMFAKSADSSALSSKTGTPASKQPDKAIENKLTKLNTKDKAAKNKKLGNSKFEVGLKVGLNASGTSGKNVFFEIFGSYYISPKLGVGIGANVLSSRVITGSYSNSNYKYTTIIDTNKQVTHTADKLVVNSSRKIYTVDIPVMVTYKVSNLVSFNAGPVISIPIKTGAIKNTLNPINNPTDTLSAYKTITTAANSTTISNKVNFSLSGGVTLHVKRFFIDAGYVQGISPYTISSSLGSSKIYYHTFQFGIGYKLFKSKPKQ
jgi:hypothetical protein